MRAPMPFTTFLSPPSVWRGAGKARPPHGRGAKERVAAMLVWFAGIRCMVMCELRQKKKPRVPHEDIIRAP